MAIHEVRVTPTQVDPLGKEILSESRRTLGLDGIEDIGTTTVYRLEGITETEAAELAGLVLTDPITETFVVNKVLDNGDAHVIEVAYKPGVMNPAVASLHKAADALGIDVAAADVSREYSFTGRGATEEAVGAVASRLLVNKTVENIVTESPNTLVHEGTAGAIASVPIRGATMEQLAEISKDKLFLNDEEMAVVQQHFKGLDRDPTDAELEIIAARWSEHCGHKTFNARVRVEEGGVVVEKLPLFTRIKEAAEANFGERVISAFSDNSGVIRFYDGWAINGKVETHNSPSAIEPYGGAMTGSGGVFRDVMGTGQGAKTIISTDMFCFAPPDLDETMLPTGTLHPDYLQRRVVQGVRDYGNRMGIPTGNGSIHYHEDFRAKPTVIVGAYGIMPESRAEQGSPQVGDVVVIIGGRTGRDGIHGATFSSGEMTDRTAQVNSSAVQIGNAIEEKRTFDALLEARDLDLIRAMTDCGAAGFSSAIGELGENVGLTVDISRAPLKYPGLAPWEIWVSESQERMVAAIAPENLEQFLATCSKYNVEAVAIGEFDGTHTLTVNYGDQNVAELDYEFLKNGLPQRVMNARWERPVIKEVRPEAPRNAQEWIERFKAVLSHGNVCSKEPVVRQYDHGVQGGNIVSPFGGADQSGPNDALVVRPLLGKPYGVVQSHGMNPILNRIDPFEGTKWAIAEAAANYVAVGGDLSSAAAVGNYIWPFPDEDAMGSLDLSVDAAVEMMHALQLPVISGKDSLSSTYRAKNGEVIKIPPVYAMSIFGSIPDVEKTVTSDIKKPGESTLYMVGKPSNGMGGSTYYDVTGGSSADIPKVDTDVLPKTLSAVERLIQSGHILSCHDISEGGVATAVAEMCFGGQSGADISLPNKADQERFLFNETAGCFVVEVSDDVNFYLELGITEGELLTPLGKTTGSGQINVKQFSDALGEQNLFTVDANDLKDSWQSPMKEVFHG